MTWIMGGGCHIPRWFVTWIEATGDKLRVSTFRPQSAIIHHITTAKQPLLLSCSLPSPPLCMHHPLGVSNTCLSR